MARRRKYHQREHLRTSRRGVRFKAGRKAINTKLHLTVGQFSWDEGPYFLGYSDSRTKWNGFECPYFEKAVAQTILHVINAQERKDGKKFHYTYDRTRDAFIISGDDYESSNVIFEGETFQTPDGPKKLYCIGGWMWTWHRKGGRP